MNIIIYGLDMHGVCIEESRYFLNAGNDVRVVSPVRSKQNNDITSYFREIGVQVLCGEDVATIDSGWPDLVIKSPSLHSSSHSLDRFCGVTNGYGLLFSSPIIGKVRVIVVSGLRGKTYVGGSICHALSVLGKKTHLCGSCGNSPVAELALLERGDLPQYLVSVMTVSELNEINSTGFKPFCSVFTGSDESLFKTAITNSLFRDSENVIVSSRLYDIAYSILRHKRGLYTIEQLSSKMGKSVPASMTAAYSVIKKTGFSETATRNSLKSFKGVPGCNELVLRTENVIWCNSSNSDVPEAVNFSMSNFAGCPVHLMCGGDSDFPDVSSMASSLKNAVTVHLLSGSFTDRCLIPYLRGNNIPFFGPFDSMSDAVDSCRKQISVKGPALQAVLLAPGAQCYRSFGSEHERSLQFSRYVRSVCDTVS